MLQLRRLLSSVTVGAGVLSPAPPYPTLPQNKPPRLLGQGSYSIE
jgi:hypothetical protein